MSKNPLRKVRESLMISKAELSRKAKISPVTIRRIEKGKPCRIETKRKILLALGLKVSDRNKVFSEDMDLSIKNKKERRLFHNRRRFSYNMFIPERRSEKERRNGNDRR